MEIILATLPIPTKEDLKGKGPASSTATSAQPSKLLMKDKLVIKMKPRALLSFFFSFLFLELLFLFLKFVIHSTFCNQLALFLRLSSMIIISFSFALVVFVRILA